MKAVTALLEDTDVGAVSFYNAAGQPLAHVNGRSNPEKAERLIDFVKANWQLEREAEGTDCYLQQWNKPS